jgi:hypothetical protein
VKSIRIPVMISQINIFQCFDRGFLQTPGYYFVQGGPPLQFNREAAVNMQLSDLVIFGGILQQITLLDLRDITNISFLARLHNLMEDDPIGFSVLT